MTLMLASVGSVKVQYDIRNYSWVGPNYSNGYSIYNNSFLALWSTTTCALLPVFSVPHLDIGIFYA